MRTFVVGNIAKKFCLAAVLSLGALACGMSSAAVMTFSGLPPGETSMSSYTEAGITAISTDGNIFWDYPSGQQLHLDPTFFGNSSYDFIFDGGPFSVTSVDVSYADSAAIGIWTAYDALDNLIATYAMSASTIHTDSGFDGFTGVYRLHLQDIDSHFSIDNLTLDEDSGGTVPEPYTGALFGIGLLGFAASRRFKGKRDSF
jgi:hypothetical protein